MWPKTAPKHAKNDFYCNTSTFNTFNDFLDPRATSSESDIKADGRFTGMYNVTMNIISNTAHCELSRRGTLKLFQAGQKTLEVFYIYILVQPFNIMLCNTINTNYNKSKT